MACCLHHRQPLSWQQLIRGGAESVDQKFLHLLHFHQRHAQRRDHARVQRVGALQRRGLIRYARGRITVLDRPGLEVSSCECYAVVKKEYDRLLPDQPAV